MKKTLTIFAVLMGLFLHGQVKQEETFTDLFKTGPHTVTKYKDGSIWIFFQNAKYSTIIDTESIDIGDDIESAILFYQEILNVLQSEEGIYELSNGMSVHRGKSPIIILSSGDGPSDGYTYIGKYQCKKGIKKLSELQ